MQEFIAFLGKHEFLSPGILAPLSVYLQLAIGVAFVLGLVTRWAGIFCVIIFVVAIVMVDSAGGMRGIFPSGCLVVIGLYLATHGAGPVTPSTQRLGANEAPRTSGGVRLMR